MSINRDSFKSAAERKTVMHTVPGIGEVQLRSINALEYSEVVSLYQARTEEGISIADKARLMVDANCTLIRYAVRDENGGAIFGVADREFLANMDARVFQDLAVAATEHCGLADSVEELVGNSETVPPEPTPTD